MFAPLNTKTEYSFLDSVVKVDDYLETAHRLGYQTVGICDVGNQTIFMLLFVLSEKLKNLICNPLLVLS